MFDLTLLIVWLSGLVVAYVLLFWVLPWWARRTPNDVDDVVVGVLQTPLLITLLLLALTNLLGITGLPAGAQQTIRIVASLFLIIAVIWGVWRLIRDIILYYGRRLARRSETNFDDVLIPVLDVLTPVVMVVMAVILMMRLLGANLTAIATTTGGAAVIAGLAMRDTLSNMLGGLALLIDTPFRFGDLVVWEGVVCQIRQVGLRVTTFYNTEDHAEVYIPNSLLAASKLINLTRPSPDLRVPIPVMFADGQRAEAARDTLYETADANPYILGDVRRKIDAMGRAQKAAAPGSLVESELKWGLETLRREDRLDHRLKRAITLSHHILGVIRSAEKGGFKPEEHELIEGQLGELGEHEKRLREAILSWARSRSRDPHLRGYPEERKRIVEEAELRVQALGDQLERVRDHLESRNLHDMQRLDDVVLRFAEWLPWSFKHITPAWKYPFVSIRQANAAPLPVQLIVYVDDIHLEGFLRRQRAISALSQAITERLRRE